MANGKVGPPEADQGKLAEDDPQDAHDADDRMEEDDVDPQRAERLLSLNGRNNGNGVYGEEVDGDEYPYGTLGEHIHEHR